MEMKKRLEEKDYEKLYKDMKNQLINANKEIKKLRRIVEQKNKQLASRRKERYKNAKRG